MKELSLLRAQSIRDQLDGKLARDTDEQNPDDRADASMIDLNDLNDMGL